MFSLIKFIIWIVGLVFVSAFILNYFGYEINQNYFRKAKLNAKNNLMIAANNLCSKEPKTPSAILIALIRN